MAESAQKSRRRANLNPLYQRYIDAGIDMDDIVTEALPSGGVRLYVREKLTETDKISGDVKIESDWSNAPPFE